MQRHLSPTLGWVLSASMVLVLALVCALQLWAQSQREVGVAATFVRGFARLEQKLDISNARWQSLLEAMAKQEVKALSVGHSHIEPVSANAFEGGEGLEPVTSKADADPLSADTPLILPPVPEGVVPEQLVRRDLMEILEDPLLNPAGKKLTMLEAVRGRAELTRARSLMEILESEIRVEYNVAMEELRPQGEFIEYAPGEKYQTFEGVITVGEVMPGGGMRMYYLYPERFPGIYEKKRQKAEIAETSTRRLLGLFSQ